MKKSYLRIEFEGIHNEDIQSTLDWADELVTECLGDTASKINLIYSRMQSNHEITMDELSWVLSELPIELIYISERLSKLQLSVETVKFKKANVEFEYTNKLKSGDTKYSASDIKQMVKIKTDGDNIAIAVYESAIDRISRYISLCKELIMGVKKIWSRRVDTEEANPIAPTDLPDYTQGG